MTSASDLRLAPHIRSKETVAFLTWKKTLALLPVVFSALFFYRLQALTLLSFSIATAMLTELFFRKIAKTRFALRDGQAFSMGLTLALFLPPALPVWMAVLGVFFAVAVGREAFGGSGRQPVSPVVAGYLFLSVSFPLAMRQAVDPMTFEAAALPLASLKEGFSQGLPQMAEILSGRVPGTLGTTFFPAILIGAGILFFQKLVFWEMPVLFFLAASLSAFGFGENPIMILSVGALPLAGFFIVSDPANGPNHRFAMRFFAVLAGVLSVVFRHLSFSFDPVMPSILLASFLSSWLDESARPEMPKPRLSSKEKIQA